MRERNKKKGKDDRKEGRVLYVNMKKTGVTLP